MRSRHYKGTSEDGSNYDLSISDLMAALCCIFVLFTIGITTSLKDKIMTANQYNETKIEIANEINNAISKSKEEIYKKFGRDLNIGFDENKLILRFSADAAFEMNQYELKKTFEQDLSVFFPILMNVLYNYSRNYFENNPNDDPKNDPIEDVRIEGFSAKAEHDAEEAKIERRTLRNIKFSIEDENEDKYSYLKTNNYLEKFYNDVGPCSDHDYITGFTLSQQRTMNVLSYCMYIYTEGNPEISEKEWVRSHISASGYSFIRPLNSDGEETTITEMDVNKTRRVEIRIKTNADKIVSKMQTNKVINNESK